jgi:hypothetical protein
MRHSMLQLAGSSSSCSNSSRQQQQHQRTSNVQGIKMYAMLPLGSDLDHHQQQQQWLLWQPAGQLSAY